MTKTVISLPLYENSDGILYEILEPKSNEFTHDIYKFPTKFVPEVPRWALRKFTRGNNFAVIDPFCGSGTTLVESSLIGKFSIGVDVNPFCQLLSKVKTTPFSSKQFKESEILFNKMVNALKCNRPISTEDIPNLPNINHWFQEETIKNLALVRNCIVDYINGGGSADVADFFKVCLACIVKKVSLADEQSPKPYVSRRFPKKPKSVIDEFIHVYTESIKSLREFSNRVKESYSYIPPDGDARRLFSTSIESFIEEKSLEGVDLMITSPPYINAYDLVRTFKLELFWLDLITVKEVKSLKERHIGTEEIRQVLYNNGKPPKTGHSSLDEILEKIYEVDRKRAFVVWRFFVDMEKNIKQAFDLLLPGCHYVIVIGDSVIRGNKIYTSKILSNIGRKMGFKEVERLSYIIKNHYLRIPRGNRGGKVQIDHISVLRKP
jgi:hypothetical protein